MRTEGMVRIGSTLVDPLFNAIEAVFENLLSEVQAFAVPPPAQMAAPPVQSEVEARDAVHAKTARENHARA